MDTQNVQEHNQWQMQESVVHINTGHTNGEWVAFATKNMKIIKNSNWYHSMS